MEFLKKWAKFMGIKGFAHPLRNCFL